MSRPTLLATADAFVNGYNTWTLDAILAPRAPNCTQRVIPSRLDRPTLNNDQYREYFTPILGLFREFHVTPISVVCDDSQRKVTIHARSSAETAIGAYGNEYCILLTMDESGEKIVEILEFVDSGYSEDFFPRLREHYAMKAKMDAGEGETEQMTA
jgi:ketosteroid isomerase-like protein